MRELDLIYGPECEIGAFYGREPGRALEPGIESIMQKAGVAADRQQIVTTKLYNYCRKLYMMHAAGRKTIQAEASFILGQNREFPALIWEEEIELLYHLEAMILFARSALDLGACVFSSFLSSSISQPSVDSFNDFSKRILKTADDSISELRDALRELEDDEDSWYRLLCGTSKGRSLRDKIAHQTIVHIDYRPIRPNSDKEFCHVIMDNYWHAVPLPDFVDRLCSGVVGFCLIAEDLIVRQYPRRTV